MKVTFNRGKAVTQSAVEVTEVPEPTKTPAPLDVIVSEAEVDEEAAAEAALALARTKKAEKKAKEAAEAKAKAIVVEKTIEAASAVSNAVVSAAVANATIHATNDAATGLTVTVNEPKHELARPQDVSNGIVQGDFDESDDRLPRLQIVAGSGVLSTKYTPGTILLEDAVFFSAVDPSKPQPSFRFIPLGLIKAFRERLDQNDPDNKDVIPRIVHTKEEVLRLGGTTEWQNGEQPTWNPTATIPMLIEKPESTEHAGFNLQAGKKFYCPAVFYASGTSYREVALKIYNTSKYQLVEVDVNGQSQRIIYKKFWTAKLSKVPSGSYTVFTFDVRVGDEITGTDVRELCQRFLTGVSGKKIDVAE